MRAANGYPLKVRPAGADALVTDATRERLVPLARTLTATHLRCEQGVCGACTLLIDGHPARSCITYAVLCEGADSGATAAPAA